MFFSKKKNSEAEKPSRPIVVIDNLQGIDSKNQLNVGSEIIHKTLGKGTIKDIDSNTVKVDFIGYEPKDLLIDICLENKLLYNGDNE